MISLNEFNQVIAIMNAAESFSFWNISTNINNILKIFDSNFKRYKNIVNKEEPIILYTEESDDNYQLVILENDKRYNLTPKSQIVNDFVSVKDATMTQYLKVLVTFSAITANKSITSDYSYYATGYLLKDIIINDKEWEKKQKILYNNLIYNARENKYFAREFIYGTILSFLIENSDDFEFVTNIKAKKNNNIFKTFDIKELTQILENCGYHEFHEVIGSFDYSDIHSILIILNKIGLDTSIFIFD